MDECTKGVDHTSQYEASFGQFVNKSLSTKEKTFLQLSQAQFSLYHLSHVDSLNVI